MARPYPLVERSRGAPANHPAGPLRLRPRCRGMSSPGCLPGLEAVRVDVGHATVHARAALALGTAGTWRVVLRLVLVAPGGGAERAVALRRLEVRGGPQGLVPFAQLLRGVHMRHGAGIAARGAALPVL